MIFAVAFVTVGIEQKAGLMSEDDIAEWITTSRREENS